jgi:hypothetical protein
MVHAERRKYFEDNRKYGRRADRDVIREEQVGQLKIPPEMKYQVQGLSTIGRSATTFLCPELLLLDDK